MATHKYSFHEERGEFHGYVEDEMGNVVFEMHYPEYYEDDTTGELIEGSSLFEDGYMKHHDDTDGLKKYLVSVNILEDDDELLSEDEYEKSYMAGGQTGAYGHGTTLLAKGDIVAETKKELSKNFELPYEIAIYVPSTESGNVIINKGEFQKRIDEVRAYLADLFGGFSSGDIEGGYVSDNKGLIREDIVRVVSFASKEGFKDKFNQLQEQVRVWCKEWGQESMGVEFEGDLFYVSANSQFANGGDITEEDVEREDEEENNEEKHLEELSDETSIPTDVIEEYASDRGIDIMDLRASDVESNYIGRYDSREDFAEQMVDDGVITDLSSYLEMYDRDKEMFADEEADARMDGMDDEDIVRAADMEDEYDEAKNNLERIDELKDEIEELESSLEELSDEEDVTEEESEKVDEKRKEIEDELEEKQNELRDLEYQDNDLDDIVDNARQEARDNIYQEILDDLNRDAVGYFTDNLGYDISDLATHSLFTVDYDGLADDLEHDHTFIEGDDGDLYVFRNYKWGGKLEHGGSVEQGNFRMLLNQAKELKHHAEELEHVLSKRPRVDAWVVALAERASLSLSDITHYLDGTIHDEKASDSDVVNMNVPTYIRTLEFAREDAKDDVDLHKLAENALDVTQKEGVVAMDDYEEIVPKMANGGDVRKIKGRNFGEQIENNRKFKELIQKVFDDQSGEHKYPIEFIKAIALTPHPIVKSEGKNYVKGYSYKGTITYFDFLDDANFVKALEYVDRPSIKKFASGGNTKWKVDPTYTHFAIKKSNGKIVTGWEYKDTDNQSIKYYTNMDLKDMDLNPKDFKILTASYLKKQGVDPFDSDNWGNEYRYGGVNLGGSFEKMKGQMKDEYDEMDSKLKSENQRAEEIKKGLIEEGYKVKSFSKGNYEEDANIELEKGVNVSVSLDGKISIVVENSDGTLNFIDCGRSEGMMYNRLRGLKKFAKGGEVDLFETPEKIPAKVREVLDAFADGIESGEYDVLQKAQEAVEAVGYTFDFGLDGTMSDLRKMGKTDSYARGGETKKYQIYHPTLASALEEVENWVDNNGYEFTNEGYFPDVTTGGINYGETKRFSRPIYKQGKKKEGTLMVQIYRMDSGKYELNMYPSYAKGGETTFQEKVTKIAKKNVGKAVPKSVQKDYGKRYNKKEALDSARRIVGAMKAKGKFK